MDAGVVTVVAVTTVDCFVAALEAKLFRGNLSLLLYVVVSIGPLLPDPLFRWPADGSSM